MLYIHPVVEYIHPWLRIYTRGCVSFIHLWLRIYTCGLYTNLFIIKHCYCGARYGVYSENTTLDLGVFGPDGLAALSISLTVASLRNLFVNDSAIIGVFLFSPLLCHRNVIADSTQQQPFRSQSRTETAEPWLVWCITLPEQKYQIKRGHFDDDVINKHIRVTIATPT